jgi:hypothetical protein
MTNMTPTEADLGIAEDEKVLWRGKPEIKAYIRQRYVKTSIIGILVVAVIVLGFDEVLSRPDEETINLFSRDGAVVLVSTGFILFMGLIAATSVIWGRYEGAATDYVLTDQRLIIAKGWPNEKLFVYPPYAIGGLNVEKSRDGTASLYFRDETPIYLKGIHRKRVGFEGIRDVDDVYRLIHESFYE